MPRHLFLLATLAVSACAQPLEGRIATRLQQAGLSPSMAQCMADRWVHRLSVLQLQKIQHLTNDITREYQGGRLTAIAFVERVRRVDDPEIFEVVSSSVAVCALKA